MIRVSAYGRIGADPVERETKNGKAMVTVSLAVSAGRPAADHYPILSLHWPNLSTPQAPPSNHFSMAFSARRRRAVFLVACLKRVLKCQMRK